VYLELLIEEKMREGMSRADAACAARLELGRHRTGEGRSSRRANRSIHRQRFARPPLRYPDPRPQPWFRLRLHPGARAWYRREYGDLQHQGGRSGTGGASQRRIQATLVASEIAL
jgi:hypothetical protein